MTPAQPSGALEALARRYPALAPCLLDLERAFELLRESYAQGKKVLVCGNGGSAADGEHLVGELMKGFLSKRPIPDEVRRKLRAVAPDGGDYLADHLQGALPTLSLASQLALLTAYANDVAADMGFAQQVYGYGLPGDALIGISTSGNSANVVHALQVARALGLGTVGFTGRGGGRMAPFCDVLVAVPSEKTAEIQERQLPLYHALCAMLEEHFFPS
jgi:D-sedoheptulose 7-phosphate isomerase